MIIIAAFVCLFASYCGFAVAIAVGPGFLSGVALAATFVLVVIACLVLGD